MEYPELFESVSDLWSTFTSADGFALFGGFLVFGGFIAGFIGCLITVVLGDLMELLHEAVPLIRRRIKDRKRKISNSSSKDGNK